MGLALYGKLISKRDFIAVDLPNGFLARWEPWLQGSMSAAMHEFGQAWPQIFFTAPIWRFWFGSAILGTQVLGVMMPSMDGVGRQFPLTLLATPSEGRIFRSLLHDPQTNWFERAEDFLLSTLEDGVTFEASSSALQALDVPVSSMIPDLPDGVSEASGVTIAVGHPEADYAMPLAGLVAAYRARQDETKTLWWTIGGEQYPPLAFEASGLPPASIFGQMMRSRTPVTRAVPRPELQASQEVSQIQQVSEVQEVSESHEVQVAHAPIPAGDAPPSARQDAGDAVITPETVQAAKSDPQGPDAAKAPSSAPA